MRSDDEIDAAISAAIASPGASFVVLVRVAGLNPRSSLRFMDFAGVSFARQDLRGFDFTGADLTGCSFKDARIVGAEFEGAVLDRSLLTQAADWNEFISRQADPPNPIAEAQTEPPATFEQLLVSFREIAKTKQLRAETILKMLKAAPDFNSCRRVYYICLDTSQSLLLSHHVALSRSMGKGGLHSWLIPYLEQFLLPQERYVGGDQEARLATAFSNVVASIEDRGWSRVDAVTRLLEIANEAEERLTLLDYASERVDIGSGLDLAKVATEGVRLSRYRPQASGFKDRRRSIPEEVDYGPLHTEPEYVWDEDLHAWIIPSL